MTRVLYAEDDPQVVQMVQIYFAHHVPDWTLDIARGGQECLAAMARGGYDTLLLDLVMPDLDGLQVLGELTARRDPTPVIMVSAQGQYDLAVRALRAGAADCIDKNSPDFRRIHEIVRHTLARLRRHARVAAAPPRAHRVLFLDADPAERRAATLFFQTGAPHLQLDTDAPAALARFTAGETTFDAVVLGPNWPAAAMLDALRHLRTREDDVPVIVVAATAPGETAVAAFKLGAHDYLLHGAGWLPELVFSLNQALKLADTARLNAQLTDELAALNQSLADQVAARTRELENEVLVRREAEHRAQSLSTRLLRVQEDERRALAQELHDQIGQLLTGLRFQLEAAKKGGPLDEALTLTDDLLQSVRALTLSLRPRMLDDLGLSPALDWQTKLFARQTGIAVELELSLPCVRLPPELEIVAYRVVQEALTNVARHSGARAAVVTVTASDTELHVEISDRGRGFDATAALARNDSLGLAGLAERVRLAGGRLEIVSQPAQGTRLHAEFPLPPPAG
ncbi:MAG: response regulator [Verrucomicrobia bacterium]|nr:response regulator [Verrucomicrobiota bacterium]